MSILTIRAWWDVTISDLKIEDNSCLGEYYEDEVEGRSAGLTVTTIEGELSLSNIEISRNTCTWWVSSAFYAHVYDHDDITLDGFKFSENVWSNSCSHGTMYFIASNGNSDEFIDTLEISNSSFVNNVAPLASAIYSSASLWFQLDNVTIKGNRTTIGSRCAYV